jgi:selenide, water dikinase
MQVLRQLPILNSRNLLVGAAAGDDAGVYRIDRNRALVQTTDFFTPIVDDPIAYGQIAAANALSDVYAMGGRPLTALNLMGIPADLVPPRVINLILRGGAAKIKEAKCALIGGHTIRNPEPIYGLAVTGMVSPRRMLTNAKARAGDVLILTKPLFQLADCLDEICPCGKPHSAEYSKKLRTLIEKRCRSMISSVMGTSWLGKMQEPA